MFASFQKDISYPIKASSGVKRGIFWTTLTNLITMAGMGFLFSYGQLCRASRQRG